MKYKKILSTILSLTLITTSSGVATFAESIGNKVSRVNMAEVGFQRSTLFNDGWKFNLGDVPDAKNKNYDDESWRSLTLPHDWSIEQDFNKNSPSTHEGGFLDGGIGWYRKSFVLPKEMEGKKITIDFDGVYMDSYIYVNGEQVGNHPYGYTPFSFDITDNLICDGVTENVISVKVNNRQPSSRWYSGSGIYRDVKLTVTNKVYVEQYGTYVTTPNLESEYAKGKATVNIKTDITNEEGSDKEVNLISTIYDAKGNKVGDSTSTQVINANSTYKYDQNIEVKNPELWGIENPYLYSVVTTVLIDNEVVDEYETEFGMRWFDVTTDNGFFLNGEQMKLEGVCMHHDQGALGAVANEAAIRRQVKILKDMGVNSIRVTHNPAAQVLIDICNEEGILLIDEAFDTWYGGKKTYDYGRFFEQKSIHDDMTWAEYDVKQMVNRGKNAPSIIMWSLGNEIWESNQPKAIETAKNLQSWVKEIDTTRPTTFGEDKFRMGEGTGGHEKVASVFDVVGFNYAEANYDSFHEKYPDWVLYGSETSSATRSRGVYSHPESTSSHTHDDLQQSDYDNDHVGWGRTAEDAWKRDRDREYILGEYIWTGFDYIGEPTPYYSTFPAKSSYFGAIDTAGFEKDIYYFYQSQWSDEPMVHLLPHWNWENDNSIKVDGNKILVKAYTNANSVDLYYNEDVNSDKLGTLVGSDEYEVTNAGYNGEYKETDDGKLHLEFKVEYKPGKLTAVAKDENGEEIARDVVKTASEAKAIDLSADRQVIEADGYDLSYITVDIVDENGTLVPNANNLVNFEVSGNGVIVGVDNGNAASVERYKDNKREAFNGKALVIVQSTKDAGSFTLTATSNGLTTDTINVYTVEEEDLDQNKIVGYDVSDITVPVNGKLNLPEVVTALYTDGTRNEVNVTWEDISEDKLSQAGIFEVRGSIENSNIPVVLNVIVRDMIGAQDVRILTAVGKVATLPNTVSLVFNDGTTEDKEVTWERELTVEDVFKIGTVEILGSIEGISGIQAKAIIVVSDNYEEKNVALREKGEYPKAFTSYSGPDNINNINDSVISKGNDPQNRWTNWGKASQDYDDYVGIEFDKVYTISRIGLSLYSDSGVAIPSEIIVEYFDGNDWMKVSNQSKTTGFTVEDTEEITFDAINTTKIRALLKEDTAQNKAVGLTEFEVYSNVLVSEGTALLNDIKVNGGSIEGFTENNTEYSVVLPYGAETPVVSATAKDNASVFVVPALTSNGVAKVLVTAEDGSVKNVYSIRFREESAKLENVEISLSKEDITEDDVVDINVDAKLQDNSTVAMSNLDIKYYVTSENNGEAKIDGNKLSAYTAGDISLYAEVTYKGVTKVSNTLNFTILENTAQKTAIAYEKVIVETEKGVKPELPTKVKATFDIGLPRDVEVTWDEVDQSKYNEYGVFEVKGTVEGQELKATAKVIVKGISALGNVSLVTNVGVEPSLPDTVKAYYTDGSTKDLSVAWEDYNKELLLQEGVFEVTGVVDGVNIIAKANIRVSSDIVKGDNIARARNGYDLPMAIASYTNDTKVDAASQDSIEKVNDGLIEHDPNSANNRWSNWKRGDKNSSEWVGIIFGVADPLERYINNLEVDFFEDNGTKIPSNITIQYYVGDEIVKPENPAHVLEEANSPLNDENNWRNVTNLVANPSSTSGSDTNYYTFDMVKTYALRIKMDAQSNMGLGITEIKAFEERVVANNDFEVKSIKVNGNDLEGFNPETLDYSLALKKGEALPEITVDVNNNASVTTVYTVESSEKSIYAINGKEELDVVIKSEDGLKEVRYTIAISREDEENIINKSLLQYTIEYAEKVKADGALEGVVPAVVREFNDALENAKIVLANEKATEAEVDAITDRLLNAIWMLEFKGGDKETLKLNIELVEKLNKNDYTKESWESLQEELNRAKEVYENENALVTDIEEAINNLRNAINALVKKDVNKILLQELVTMIGGLNSNEYIYTTWENLDKNLELANKVLINEEATQEEVDMAYNNLLRAYLELRLKPSKDKLEDLINKAESLNKENYTEETWEKVEDALEKAKVVMANENSTEEEITQVENELEVAIEGLIASNSDNNDNNSNGGNNNGNTNNNGNSNGTTNNGGNVGSNTNNNGNNATNLPKTGAATSVATVLALGSLLVGCGASMIKKKED
ncbi:Ig-like domain-containing protein [uncultured Clostridium sp.]|uniref:Ig-like domain-containing protein n=1 Tax=uncultured Clostridium sp. TaxID=59620 RepID=UPI0025F42B86|nr:Ig-like domain-containing protein [uncultured Clostridium sp.]MDU4884438.1 Ig-like domain-containing protein [Clostridium celatum]MDU7077575.1 Ig-like domain-containing protein [Clostridium celatum]